MRCAHLFCAGLLTALLAATAAADEAEKKKDDSPKAKQGAGDREEMHRKMLKEFDKDGDGKLNEEERAKAREFRHERMRAGDRERPRPPRGAEGGRPEGRRPDGRGPEGRGPEGRRTGPGGPGAMPHPERLFNAFDADKDDKLSREEFGKLVEKLREMGRPHGPGGPPEGRRPGPPPEGRRPGRPDADRPRPRRESAGEEKPKESKEAAPKEKAEDADKATA